jgi:hypothetical protein
MDAKMLRKVIEDVLKVQLQEADNNDIDIALERAKRTTLTEWFSINKIICFTYRR